MSLDPIHLEQETSLFSADTATPFLVGLFFSFRLFIMLLSVRAFGTEPQTGTEISIALNLLLLGVVAIQSAGAADRTFASTLKIPSTRWILFFILFSGCSLLWSVAASLAAAAAYWCAMASDVLMVGLLLRRRPVAPIIHSLMKGYVSGACMVAIIAWILPGQSDLRLGDDELLGANQIGYLCAFAFFFAQYLMLQRAGRCGMAAVLLGVTLLRSLSKTTIVAFLVAEGFLLMRDKLMSRRTKLMVLSSTALIGLVFSGLLTSYFDLYANTGNSPETLTGRLAIWSVMLEEGVNQPWIGHGFYSIWKVIPPFGEFEARHAHNEIIQQFYLYGVAGLFMMVGLYVSFYGHVRRNATGSVRTFHVALLLFVLIRGIADTEIVDFSFPLWALLMFSVLLEQENGTTVHTIAVEIPCPSAGSFGLPLQS